jgi:hypothetical protein
VRILSIERFDRATLLADLRRTPLLGYGGRAVYEHADLALEPAVATDRLAPAQRYVLREGIARVLALRDALLEHGVDLFQLDGGAYVRMASEPDLVVPVIPPVVEVTTGPDGAPVLLVGDGMHRVYAARRLGVPISVVLVRGVPHEFPYYALVEPGGWDAVREFDALPRGFVKKHYRMPDDRRALYRDFNAVFPGVQTERDEGITTCARATPASAPSPTGCGAEGRRTRRPSAP